MAVANKNLLGVDLPFWEALNAAPAASAAGVSIDGDGIRYVYCLFSQTAFWRFCSWTNTWQQLASPPAGTLGTGTAIRYVVDFGGQSNGVVYGSVWALISNGVAAPTFQVYDIATNAWTAKVVTNLPATFGTDAALVCPEPNSNGYTGAYHAGVITTVTAGATAAISATAITVVALPFALPAGAVLNFGTLAAPVYAVLTAAAAAAAISITVAPLVAAVNSGAVAYYYDHFYLVGNNGTVMYRYSISGNAWALTSANSGTPALVAVTAAVGAGCAIRFLPAVDPNALFIFRGTATATVYKYSLLTNTIAAVVFQPVTETFTAGTVYAVRADAQGRALKVLIQKDATSRIFEFNPVTLRLDPASTQWLLPQGAAVVGDKMTIMKTPDGIEFLYFLLNTSANFVRSPMLP